MNVKLTEKQKIKIINSSDVFDIMQRVLKRENKIDRDKEHFWIIGLATNNKILFIELVSLGSLTETVVKPMNVFRVAVLKGAAKVVLVHNHPSGELRPSEHDNDITDRLIQVGRILSITVIDHLIISLNSFLSYVDIGLLEELSLSTKWVPSFELEERIRKEEKKIRQKAVKAAKEEGEKKGLKKGLQEGEEKGLKKGLQEGEEKGSLEKAVEMALLMKKDNKSPEEIRKYTQLSLEEIKKL